MKNILIEQNKHWQDFKYDSIKRKKLKKVISYLPLKQIITITGIRRCGKSTLVKQAINYLIENKVNSKNILFINLEHPYFLEYKHDVNFLNIIYDEYVKLINPIGKVYCVFDEIQYFDNWQVFAKNKYETTDIKFIITGSNSSMLSNELNTLLSGRALSIHLDTFSFEEFLDYKQIDYKSEFSRIANKIDIARAKDEYLKWGGFFEIFDIADETIKKELLISYAKNIIYQDIVPRYNIRNSHIVERLFFYLLSITTGILNYTTLARTFEITDKSIKEYINYFEDTFLFKRIDRFYNKPRVKIKSTKKLYLLDNGFLQIAQKHSINNSTALENCIFNLLNQNENNLTYLKETYEIDFFSENKLYQISYDISDEKALKRELNPFKHFKYNHDIKSILITYDTNKQFDDVQAIGFEEFIFTNLMGVNNND